MRFKDQADFNNQLAEALEGDRLAQARLKEAITSDQLAPMFVKAANVRFQEYYDAHETIWDKIATKELLSDFRASSLLSLKPNSTTAPIDNGGYKHPVGTLPHVPELTPYPTMSYQADGAFITTAKHGARVQFSFEAFINDQWNVISRFPKDAAAIAARTEDLLVLLQLFDPAKKTLRTDVFNDFNKTKAKFSTVPEDIRGDLDILHDVYPLSFNAVVAARYQALATIRDGHSTYVPEGFVLVTNPALAEVAKGYTQINEIRVQNGKRTDIKGNPLKDLEVVTSDLISVVGGDNAWVLLPKGGRANGKTVLAKTGMLGREAPELRIHNATGQMIGGGDVNPYEGSFDNDDIEIRIRQIAGAGLVSYDGIIGSTGLPDPA